MISITSSHRHSTFFWDSCTSNTTSVMSQRHHSCLIWTPMKHIKRCAISLSHSSFWRFWKVESDGGHGGKSAKVKMLLLISTLIDQWPKFKTSRTMQILWVKLWMLQQPSMMSILKSWKWLLLSSLNDGHVKYTPFPTSHPCAGLQRISWDLVIQLPSQT